MPARTACNGAAQLIGRLCVSPELVEDTSVAEARLDVIGPMHQRVAIEPLGPGDLAASRADRSSGAVGFGHRHGGGLKRGRAESLVQHAAGKQDFRVGRKNLARARVMLERRRELAYLK